MMARTTLDIDRSVLDQLRKQARARAVTMGELASVLLAEALASQETARGPVELPSYPMGRARIDLDDRAALWEFLDGETFDGISVVADG